MDIIKKKTLLRINELREEVNNLVERTKFVMEKIQLDASYNFKEAADKYCFISSLYKTINEFEKGADLLTDAADLYIRAKTNDLISSTYNKAGDLYTKSKKYTVAIIAFQLAIEYSQNIHEKSSVYIKLGDLYEIEGDLITSIKCYNIAKINIYDKHLIISINEKILLSYIKDENYLYATKLCRELFENYLATNSFDKLKQLAIKECLCEIILNEKSAFFCFTKYSKIPQLRHSHELFFTEKIFEAILKNNLELFNQEIDDYQLIYKLDFVCTGILINIVEIKF